MCRSGWLCVVLVLGLGVVLEERSGVAMMVGMATDDGYPRDRRGLRPCAWCGGPIQQPAAGRLREYCRRSCRQRAYEARREAERIAAAVARASVSSRDETEARADPTPRADGAPHAAQGGGQSGSPLRSVGSAVVAAGSEGAAEPAELPPQVRWQGARADRPEGTPATPPEPPTNGKITADPLPLWE